MEMVYKEVPSSEQLDSDGSDIEYNSVGHHNSGRKRYWFVSLWLLSLVAPVYDTIDIHLDVLDHNRTLWDDGTNIFRHDPNSTEGQAAWDAIVRWNPVLIDHNDMKQLGLPLEGTVQWPDATTDRKYVARMDIFHLLHCVNELREAIWMDSASLKDPNPAYWAHKKHCADIIRQEIMCTGSLNLYRMMWSDHQRRPWPEFTIHRQCRRWDDILAWHDKHKLNEEEFTKLSKMTKPEDAYAYPMAPEGIALEEAVGEWERRHGIEDE